MILGVHVSTEGGVFQAAERAHALGCNTMQFFSRSPRMWRASTIKPEDIKEFRLRQEKYKIDPVFIHIPYLINLASPDEALYSASIKAYIKDVEVAADLGVEYIVTHMGSHRDTSEAQGIARLTAALNRIMEATRGKEVSILLENTSGSGSYLGYTFSHQQKVIQGLDNRDRIGICLDTAHAYTAGYDLATVEGLKKLVQEIDDLVGLRLLKLIHLNDTLDPCGSHLDRHAHIGTGRIGMQGMKRILNHPRLKTCSFILETPKDSENADQKNLAMVKKLAGI